jgi:tetratricopeptide (TPR) repeat protein
MPIPTLTPPTAQKVILGEGQRLSESILWRLQANFFEQRGVEAWRQGIVPHYITSNPFTARAYAQVVFGFLRDCQFTPDCLDQSQPIYIVELGTGSGRFAFHFYKKLTDLLHGSSLQDVPIKLVMTDYAQQNIDFWMSHARLQPLVEEGSLDFARFDAIHDRELALLNTGVTITPGSLKNPLVVMANYFFDSIPQDVFHVRGGQLYEGLVTIRADEANASLDNPKLLNQIEVSYEHRQTSADYYDDPTYNRILADYCDHLDNTTLLFPTVGLQCIRNLSQLTAGGGNMLLLAGDKGYHREGQLAGHSDPAITLHGSFSMMVNFHALGHYIVQQGGEALYPSHDQDSLTVPAFVLGQLPNNVAETRLAYRLAIAQFGPDDFYTLKKGVERFYFALSVSQILAHVRLSGWDANIFQGCLPALMSLAEEMSDKERSDLYTTIERVWDTFYPLGEDQDMAFNIGLLLYEMSDYIEAVNFFNYSLEFYGVNAGTSLNCGLCYYNLEQFEAALAWVDHSLSLDPDYEIAHTTRTMILEAMTQ